MFAGVHGWAVLRELVREIPAQIGAWQTAEPRKPGGPRGRVVRSPRAAVRARELRVAEFPFRYFLIQGASTYV